LPGIPTEASFPLKILKLLKGGRMKNIPAFFQVSFFASVDLIIGRGILFCKKSFPVREDLVYNVAREF
jgi:hypothetical protein